MFEFSFCSLGATRHRNVFCRFFSQRTSWYLNMRSASKRLEGQKKSNRTAGFVACVFQSPRFVNRTVAQITLVQVFTHCTSYDTPTSYNFVTVSGLVKHSVLKSLTSKIINRLPLKFIRVIITWRNKRLTLFWHSARGVRQGALL